MWIFDDIHIQWNRNVTILISLGDEVDIKNAGPLIWLPTYRDKVVNQDNISSSVIGDTVELNTTVNNPSSIKARSNYWIIEWCSLIVKIIYTLWLMFKLNRIVISILQRRGKAWNLLLRR
jgi:hypothetical protein